MHCNTNMKYDEISETVTIPKVNNNKINSVLNFMSSVSSLHVRYYGLYLYLPRGKEFLTEDFFPLYFYVSCLNQFRLKVSVPFRDCTSHQRFSF